MLVGMRVEILALPGCCNAEGAVKLLRRVLDEVGLPDTAITTRVIADQAAAELAGFTGSPTFLINGADPFTEPGAAPALACRLYPTALGALARLPDHDQLRQAVLSARGYEPAAVESPRQLRGSARRVLADAQRQHWQETYRAHPQMYGEQPSAPAIHAAGVFHRASARDILELGAGHGRDAVYLAGEGFIVQATDVSAAGLEQLHAATHQRGVTHRVRTIIHDIRDPLPLPDASVDAVYAHMLLCMALSSTEIRAAVGEIGRVLRPGGVLIYTVRHTGDAHYCTGIAHGDDIFEHGGFAVHFFTRQLVDDLATGWTLNDVHPFEEGELPRRLWRITQTLPRQRLGT